jgi:amidase
MVERLRAAGALFIGKTNTPEFGLGSHSFNPVFGATGNAWDVTASAGGSSGGAAVALALRMTPLADGGDYGGSLRNPAGWNNVFGFRTTTGVVPEMNPGVRQPWAWLPSMGVSGPMARGVKDLAFLLSLQAGWDARAPLALPGVGQRFAWFADGHADAGLAKWVRGKRIAWLGDLGGWAPHEAGVLEVCEAALNRFEDLGCRVEAARPEFDPEAVWRAFKTLRHWNAGGALRALAADPAKRALIKPEALWEVEEGAKLTAWDVADAAAVRADFHQAMRAFFGRYQFMVAPTAQVWPFPVGERWPRSIAGVEMSTYHEWMKLNCWVTMSGGPSLAAPAGFSERGLPMGIQIVGPLHAEDDCLRLALAYEEAAADILARLPPAISA